MLGILHNFLRDIPSRISPEISSGITLGIQLKITAGMLPKFLTLLLSVIQAGIPPGPETFYKENIRIFPEIPSFVFLEMTSVFPVRITLRICFTKDKKNNSKIFLRNF